MMKNNSKLPFELKESSILSSSKPFVTCCTAHAGHKRSNTTKVQSCLFLMMKSRSEYTALLPQTICGFQVYFGQQSRGGRYQGKQQMSGFTETIPLVNEGFPLANAL